MFNIVYFQKEIKNLSSPAYKIYQKLYAEDLLSCPIIYTDNYDIRIDHIPIFSTFYIRESFALKKILVDYNDYIYVPEFLKTDTIVVSDDESNVATNCFMVVNSNIKQATEAIKKELKYETV